MIGKWWFRGFRRLTVWSDAVRFRLTSTGRWLSFVWLASGLFGLDTQRSMTYQLFGWLTALIGLAWLTTWRFRSDCRAVRILPRLATVGEPVDYSVRVSHAGLRSQRHLVVRDQLVHPWPDWQEFCQAREPGEGKRNWFDRKVGYPKYLWLLNLKRGAKLLEGVIDLLPAASSGRGEVVVSMRLWPTRRGVLQLAPWVHVARTDPFGICRAWQRLSTGTLAAAGHRLLVFPRRYILPKGLQPVSGRCYQPGGVVLAASVGDAEEFVSLREYRDGDSMRRVHWPSYARLGRPMVKEYQQEYFVRHALVLDTMGDGPERDAIFEEAVSLAASFAAGLADGESLLDLMLVGDKDYCFTFGRGLGAAERMLELLAAVTISQGPFFPRLAHLVLGHATHLSSVILVLTGWDSQRWELVAQLQARRLPLLILVVTRPGGAVGVDPGPMRSDPGHFRVLELGRIAEGLVGR